MIGIVPKRRWIPAVLATTVLTWTLGCGAQTETNQAKEAEPSTTEFSTTSSTTAPWTTTLSTTTSSTTPPSTTTPQPTVPANPSPTSTQAQKAQTPRAQPPPSPAPPAPPQPATAAGSRVLVIDPGHNGANAAHAKEINKLVDAGGFRKACNTTGTASGSYSEAQFNWEVSQLIRDQLQAQGVAVVMTRQNNDGWGPCVDRRGTIASENNAALLLSIHADGSSEGNRGFHVIHPSSIAGYTDTTVEPSKRLAIDARDALIGAGFSTSNYIGSNGLSQRGDLGTLNRAGVPAIIVECGNMKDSADIERLRSPEGQAALADALSQAVLNYLSS